MTDEIQQARYKTALIILHAISAIAVLTAFALVWSIEIFDVEAIERNLVFVHKALGLLVLSLTLVRIGLKVTGNATSPHVEPVPLLNWAAKLGHLGLYGFLFATPLLGWLKTNAAGRVASLFGIPFPALVEKDKQLAELFGELHEVFAYMFLGLIALHFAAVIWHRVVRKDAVLYSMFPFRRFLP